MASLLITEIKSLIGIQPAEVRVLSGSDMAELSVLNNAWLLLENGRIKDFGIMALLPPELRDHKSQIKAKNRFVFPSWCDSHTHLVFAESREEEFLMKIKGSSYEEIAARGGGILNSAQKLQASPEEYLFEHASERLNEIIRMGTGAVEIKSGYGLNHESELKMLRVIRRLKESFPIVIKSTFLGAHTFPKEYRNDHEGYINLLIQKMLPQIAEEGLADFIDVFCEQGFFSVDETSRILEAGVRHGLKPKIHGNQLSSSGAVQVGVKYNALSIDHLEVLNKDSLNALKNSKTIATLLPTCSLFLGIPYADARAFINAGIPVCLASDYNPGSSPSGNMNLVVSLACIRQKMLPEEAINAATMNGAAAMELSASHGSITRGKAANVFITKPIPSLAFYPYSFGSNLIDTVIMNGEVY